MSSLKIRQALETAVSTITPALATVRENEKYTPIEGVPYQYIQFVGFIPDTAEVTKSHRICGYMQIDLMYPLLKGTGASQARAELIKDKFKKGSTFVKDDINVNILNTPEILQGRNEGDRWKIVVQIYYSAWIIVS
jgi:hypothetical protein